MKKMTIKDKIIMNTDFQNEVDALKMISIGTIISEYGLIKMQDDSKFELKNRVNAAIKFCVSVQNWFRFHPKCRQETMKVLTTQFNDSKILLLAELFKEVHHFTEETLEHILQQIQIAKLEMIQTTAFAPTESEGAE